MERLRCSRPVTTWFTRASSLHIHTHTLRAVRSHATLSDRGLSRALPRAPQWLCTPVLSLSLQTWHIRLTRVIAQRAMRMREHFPLTSPAPLGARRSRACHSFSSGAAHKSHHYMFGAAHKSHRCMHAVGNAFLRRLGLAAWALPAHQKQLTSHPVAKTGRPHTHESTAGTGLSMHRLSPMP